jgi:hypothetical protein
MPGKGLGGKAPGVKSPIGSRRGGHYVVVSPGSIVPEVTQPRGWPSLSGGKATGSNLCGQRPKVRQRPGGEFHRWGKTWGGTLVVQPPGFASLIEDALGVS